MGVLKYTRPEVMSMCKRMGLTITNEDAMGCTASKNYVIYRFQYKTEDDIRKEKEALKNAVEVSSETIEKAASMVKTENPVETVISSVPPKPKRSGRPKGSKNKAKKSD